MKYTNRELWLADFSKECVKLFADVRELGKFDNGIKLDLKDVRITCGFPPNYRKSTRAVAEGKYSAMGVCFPKVTGRPYKQIFILPDWCNNKDIVNLGGVVIHELIHAIDNCVSGHGKAFRDMAIAVGLEGSMRSTKPGAHLSSWIRKTAKKLGKYPEGTWVHSTAKQTTRMLKLTCSEFDGDCGVVARMSTSQIDSGVPLCRCTTKSQIEEFSDLSYFEMRVHGYHG